MIQNGCLNIVLYTRLNLVLVSGIKDVSGIKKQDPGSDDTSLITVWFPEALNRTR